MHATKSGRRIAAVGLVAVGAAIAGVAAWLVLTRAAPLPPPASAAKTAADAAETPLAPAVEAAPAPVARRRMKPPEPYLPPYEPAPKLTEGLVHPVMTEVEIHFPRGFGRVVSAVDARPIRDAVVGVPEEFVSGREFREYVLDLDRVRSVVRTDSEGRFELAESVVGSSFIVSAAEFGPQFFYRGWPGPSRDAPLVIELAPAAKFDARVTDRVGAPKSGIEIRLIAHAYEARPQVRSFDMNTIGLLVGAHRVTDRDGKAVFEQLPISVPFTAELWSGQSLVVRDPTPIVVEPGDPNSREWALGSGSTITGQVVDDLDQPVARQALWLTQYVLPTPETLRTLLQVGDRDKASKTIETDAEGRFKIDDVKPGRWFIGIEPVFRFTRFTQGRPANVDENAIAPVAEVVQVGPEGGSVSLELRVHRGLYIRGKAIDGSGRPVLAAVMATVITNDLSCIASESTDYETGGFVIGPLEPGNYTIEARPDSLEWRDRKAVRGRSLAPSKPLIVAAGTDDVVIRFDVGSAIHVTAVRADTGAAVRATFCLGRTEEVGSCTFTGFGESSSADFSDIDPGDYYVTVVTNDGRTGCARNLRLAEGERLDDVDIRVEPGAHLKLKYVGTQDEYAQVSIVANQVIYEADGLRRGTTSPFVAPAGMVTVRWSVGKDKFDEEVELTAGETRELVWPRTEEGEAPGQRR